MQVMILLYTLIIYVFIVGVLAPVVIPHLSTRKRCIPKKLPDGVVRVLDQIKLVAVDDYDFAYKTYEYVTGRFSGGRLEALVFIHKTFNKDPFTQKDGFMHCMGQNFILRSMLIASGRFSDSDIRLVNMPFNFFIHQYLQIKIGKKWFNVDPWAKSIGIPFGAKVNIFN